MPFCTNSRDDDLERERRERAGIYAQMLEKVRQSALDATLESHGGQALDRVKPELARRWQAATGDELVDPSLSSYAEEIAAGRRVEIGTHEL